MAKVKCPKCLFINPDDRDRCVRCMTPLPRIKIEASGARAAVAPAVDAAAVQFRRGQVLANRYTVLSLIGRGGMGCIHKVHDNILGEEVALKTLLPQFVKDKIVVERFFNEARIARRLSHPGIVRVHDIGSAGNIVYISMEFIQGKSLRGLLDGLLPGQRLPVLEILRIFEELCAALEYAHQFTIHRDIKPENVMVQEQGRVKLMDFGISKLMADVQLTGASMVMGTPFYMSPEQLRNSRDVDARADIFSLGVMLYEILTGNVPTGVPKPASQIITDVPPAIDAIVAKCVDPNADNRYRSVAELRSALRPIREAVGAGEAVRMGTTQRGSRGRFPLRKAVGVALAILLLGLTGMGVKAMETRKERLLSTSSAAASVAPANSAGGFKELDPFVERVGVRAQERVASIPDMQGAYDEGARLYALAKEANNQGEDAAAATLAARALRNFAAVFLWQPDMVFIPEGMVPLNGVSVEVPPFFIDNTEVTLEEFAGFSQKADGGWRFPEDLQPYVASYPTVPVTMVTFYDAQAFAAWEGKLLPTEAQWARAAYGSSDASTQYPWGDTWEPGAANSQGAANYPAAAPVKTFLDDLTWSKCYDMAGNVKEWTRSTLDGKPDFGAYMITRGGHFGNSQIPLEASDREPYSIRSPYLGFRCVREIPSSPKLIEGLLRSSG